MEDKNSNYLWNKSEKIMTNSIVRKLPCYNSEKYMRKCIDSLLPGGEDVEILIVDDGSTDATAAIADEYAEKYPVCRSGAVPGGPVQR